MLRLTRYVATLTKKPVISYVSDDNYTLNQFRLSPFYWINRFVLRRNMRKTYPYYSLVYTMTEEQKEIYENALHCKMSVLKKSGDFRKENVKKYIEFPTLRVLEECPIVAFSFLLPFIYLASSGLGCGMWNPHCGSPTL